MEKKEEQIKKRLSVGILYLGLHNQLKKKFGEGTTITRKEFFSKIGSHYQLPKQLRPWILKEMERAELIEKVNRDYVKILTFEINVEDEEQVCKLIKVVEKDFYKD